MSNSDQVIFQAFPFSKLSQVCFVDKQRNAAVVIGNRDLKADVASKRRRERSHNIIVSLYVHLEEIAL